MTDYTDLIARLQTPTSFRAEREAADAIAALVAERDRWKQNEELQMQRAIKAEAERNAAVADAQRWRADCQSFEGGSLGLVPYWDRSYLTKAEQDEAADAARAQEKP